MTTVHIFRDETARACERAAYRLAHERDKHEGCFTYRGVYFTPADADGAIVALLDIYRNGYTSGIIFDSTRDYLAACGIEAEGTFCKF